MKQLVDLDRFELAYMRKGGAAYVRGNQPSFAPGCMERSTVTLMVQQGVILAHEIDIHNNSKKIWLESDFMLVIQALKNSSIVPWSIRYRWENNLLFCKLNLIVSLSSNVYKERNFYAHALANHKASSKARFTRWQSVLFVKEVFLRNRNVLPNYRLL
ncbi:hypothetical protein JHK87_050472 [Glycine soja]|nr:hypothetical protein JHK87_050472 [Glycine soja]